MLSQSIKLSEMPQLLHSFAGTFFDDRYKNVLMELLSKEDSSVLTPDKVNVLNDRGFTPLLAFVARFVRDYESIKDKVKQELAYQEYLHQRNTEQYEITNLDLFKPRSVSDQGYEDYKRTHSGQGYISATQRMELELNFNRKLISEPMLALIHFMAERGADVHAKVEKVEFYRKLDEHKKHLLVLHEQRGSVQAVQDTLMRDEQAQIIDTTSAGQNRAVKTRDEVLAEQRFERRNERKNKKNKKKGAQADPNDPRVWAKKQLREFYSKQGHTPTYKTVDGKQVEVEYDKEHGLQGLLHLAMKAPRANWLMQALLDMGVERDGLDYQKRSPFFIGIDQHIAAGKDELPKSLQKLMDEGVNIDCADQANQTPFLKLYNARLQNAAEQLRLKGANVNQMSKSGIFALKIALVRRDDAEIKRLVEHGASINQIDDKGRNLLHIAVNMSSASADATFETEQLLIDLGVELNRRDCRGRVPLHYAFVKMKSHRESR